jgi:hypothetical protein
VNRKGKNMRMVAIVGSRTYTGAEAKALSVAASHSFRARQEEKLNRRLKRLSHCPERLSVAKAMFAVEQRIVEALWTLARLPNDRGVGFANRHGVDYVMDRADKWAAAVAGGGWLNTPPRPAPPRAADIDAMHEPLEWLRLLDRDQARLLSEGAMYRRGDMAKNINWNRLRSKFPQYAGLTIRTIERRYEQALRDLVALGVKA